MGDKYAVLTKITSYPAAYLRERKTYRVTVLSLLHEGRGTELHKAVALSGVGGMGATLGIGDSGVNSHLSETGTIALDGRFPSRKELGELIRLQFASAIEVRRLRLHICATTGFVNRFQNRIGSLCERILAGIALLKR